MKKESWKQIEKEMRETNKRFEEIGAIAMQNRVCKFLLKKSRGIKDYSTRELVLDLGIEIAEMKP